MENQAQVRSRPSFQYLSPTQEQVGLMQVFRDEYQSLYEKISGLPHSRGLSLAKTHLEDSAMWLNKSITQND